MKASMLAKITGLGKPSPWRSPRACCPASSA